MYKYKTIIFNFDSVLFKSTRKKTMIDLLHKLQVEGFTLCLYSELTYDQLEDVFVEEGLLSLFDIIMSGAMGLTKAQLIKQILEESCSCSAMIVGDHMTDYEAAADTGCLYIGVRVGLGGKERDIYKLIKKVNSSDQEKQNISHRVKLKPVEVKDMDEIIAIHKEAEAEELLGVTQLPQQEDFIDHKKRCYVILSEKEEFIGIVELFNCSWKNRRAELSILLKESERGKGYGYEAVQAILDIGFDECGFNRIYLRVLEYNIRAIECYKKAGFVLEGICREESLRGGKFVNQIQMSILRSEWMKRI